VKTEEGNDEETLWTTYTFTMDDTPRPIQGSDLIVREVLPPILKVKGDTLILTVHLDITKQPEEISLYTKIKNKIKNIVSNNSHV
jgi:hypothetical protein